MENLCLDLTSLSLGAAGQCPPDDPMDLDTDAGLEKGPRKKATCAICPAWIPRSRGLCARCKSKGPFNGLRLTSRMRREAKMKYRRRLQQGQN